MRLVNAEPTPDYYHCYPTELTSLIAHKACEGVAAMGCRQATPTTVDPIHAMLNTAWDEFWQNPAVYHRWEAGEVDKLLALCRS